MSSPRNGWVSSGRRRRAPPRPAAGGCPRAVVPQGNFTALGYMEARLFPFSGEIDVSSLDPGSYTLIVETDDPSGGAEGFGTFSDTRTFVLESKALPCETEPDF